MIKEILRETDVAIISGHYGSGKTEISINLALNLLDWADKSVTVADLDIINPYFRSREKKDFMEKQGVHIIGGSIEDSQTGVPALSGEVQAQLTTNNNNFLILDTGGDPEGIRLLGRYERELKQLKEANRIQHFFVYNSFRPETSDPQKGETMLRSIERSCAIPVDQLICNGHLLKATGANDILEGWNKTKELSHLTKIPISACFTPEWILPPEEIPRKMIYTLSLFMRSDWMS
jgi:hypothetical protein